MTGRTDNAEFQTGCDIGYDVKILDPRRKEFSKRLQEACDAKQWHAAELARQSGVHRQNVSAYLRGENLPSIRFLQKMAKVLDVDADWLLPNAQSARVRSHRLIDVSGAEMKPGISMHDAEDGSDLVSLTMVQQLLPRSVAIQIIEIANKGAQQAKRRAANRN